MFSFKMNDLGKNNISAQIIFIVNIYIKIKKLVVLKFNFEMKRCMKLYL